MMKEIRHIFLMLTLMLTGQWLNLQAAESQNREDGDSISVEELLILETLDLDIKGPNNEVSFYMNGLVFLSNTKYHQEMIADHIAFGQVTSFVTPLEYLSLENSKPLFSNDAFPYTPAGMSFSRDYKKVYFTKKVKISGNRNPEKIFEMDIVNGRATFFDQLPFTAGPTRFMHPTLSTNGEFMVMASDLSPSNGGLDLFIVRQGQSGWKTPVNLGADINSSGHECYPFLDQHNNLFFSSSGQMGYGGYDLFVCFFDGQGWGSPQNLGELINTEMDEVGFSVHPGRKMAVYSSHSDRKNDSKEVYNLRLDNNAYISAGIDPQNQDLSLLLQDLLSTGYTSAKFGAASDKEMAAGFSLTALPLLEEEMERQNEEDQLQAEVQESQETPIPPQEEKEEPVEKPVEKPVEEAVEEPLLIVEEPEPEPEIILATPLESAPETTEAIDPDQVVFRIQILSNAKAQSRASVTIAGKSYPTWEYYYKGAYRITVEQFSSVKEAIAFNKKCRASGFDQAFVAAFRGGERETDPSVFRQ